MHRTALVELLLMNAGVVGSHAVYPLASKVALIPPEGKLEASGSPLMSDFPEKSIITPPSKSGSINESCFSAVEPVSGWNSACSGLHLVDRPTLHRVGDIDRRSSVNGCSVLIVAISFL